jgi:hypothetical protein
MSTVASRRGYGKRKSYGFLDWDGNFPYYYNPTREDIESWARTHGYPEWPDTRPVYAYLSDVDRFALAAFYHFYDHMRRGQAARLDGRRGETAYHQDRAASCLRSYAANRRKARNQIHAPWVYVPATLGI